MKLTARWMNYRLFPYEERLGVRECTRLAGAISEVTPDGVLVCGPPDRLVDRLTYFTELVATDGTTVPTDQAITESRHAQLRTGTDRNRQATRFGIHGIHEYKGKFNPQVVRALANVVDPDASMLVDPYCGSGTTVLEALRLGLDTVGVDRSPLAWYLASTKAAATVHKSLPRLRSELVSLADQLAQAMKQAQEEVRPLSLAGILSTDSESYLQDWFTAPAFAGLSAALVETHPVRKTVHGRLLLLALSSVLRSVSLQMPEDLRIRRRPEPFVAPALWEKLQEATERIACGLEEMEVWPRRTSGRSSIVLGSADDPNSFAATTRAQRRLLLTSPPYATALPYIDTDRLSLVALGLLDVSQILPLDRALLGSREWTRAEQRLWEERSEQNIDALPSSVTNLLDRVTGLNSDGNAGFRRRAVPALLYRYFARMGNCLRTWNSFLQPGERAVLIVGHNRTTAGGETVDIRTPELLAEVSGTLGYEVVEIIKLETWPRYGMHAANSVNGEDAVILKRCSASSRGSAAEAHARPAALGCGLD